MLRVGTVGRLLAGLSLTGALAAALLGCAPASGQAAAAVATTTVDLPASYRFEPAAIVVKPGATVTWTNRDHFTHSVQVLDGAVAGEPLLVPPGASASITFPADGLYRYQCHLHPTDMQGTVTVAP